LNALPGGVGTKFTFNGVGASNAIYVDYLELQNDATNRDLPDHSGTNFTALNFNTNLVIYYAQAVMTGVSVAKKIDHWNSGHLRWVPQYAGYFSSTNMVYPDGSTNTFNASLAASSTVDSDGDGIPNASDPTPFFVDSQKIVIATPTNGNTATLVTWTSIPAATNVVSYTTNMINYVFWTNVISPPAVPPVGGWPVTNSVLAPYSPFFYPKVLVYPNSTSFYGPGF
jgi:hypothetical protein